MHNRHNVTVSSLFTCSWSCPLTILNTLLPSKTLRVTLSSELPHSVIEESWHERIQYYSILFHPKRWSVLLSHYYQCTTQICPLLLHTLPSYISNLTKSFHWSLLDMHYTNPLLRLQAQNKPWLFAPIINLPPFLLCIPTSHPFCPCAFIFLRPHPCPLF